MHALPRLAGVAVAATLALGASITANAAQGIEGVPAYDHVGVLVLENESFSSTWGSTSPATYLNSLVPGGAFADMYFGTGHVSLDNYIAMTSGQGWTPTTGSDCATQNLFQCAAVNSIPAGGIAGGPNLRYCRGAMNGLRNAGRARIPRDDMAPLARIGSSAAPGEMVIRWLIRS